MHAVSSGDQFFYPSNRNLRFRNRTRKKVYRRQNGELVGHIPENTQRFMQL